MPNLKGGKKYKSSKHMDSKPEFHEIGIGQMVGRVLKHLGDRNVLLYCNDGRERIGHIRGGLSKKKALIETGDIVLFSLRGSELHADMAGKLDRCDILAKYSHDVWNQLKKEEGINPALFHTLENMDRKELKVNTLVEEDDAFEFAHESDEEEDLWSDTEGQKRTAEDKEAREKAKMRKELKRQEARGQKRSEDRDDKPLDDVDIDNI